MTQFEKDCIDEIHAALTRRRSEAFGEDAPGMLETIKYGSEAERKAMVTTYINEYGLDEVAAGIAGVDQQLEERNQLKTDLEDKLAAMRAYIA